MQSEYYETLLHKHLAGELSAEEESALASWLEESPEHRRQLEEAERIWTLTATAHSELDINLDAEISRFKDRIQFEEAAPSLRLVSLWRYAAAAVILIGGITFLLRLGVFEPQMTTLVTSDGDMQRIELPDGTEIVLNERSELSFASAFEDRTVILKGEAFFDVAHDTANPFTIESGIGRIQVLGTSFNVRSRSEEQDILVTVASGRVAVGVKGGALRDTLYAGYQGIIQKGTGTVRTRPNDNPGSLAWQAEPLVFDDMPFNEVVNQLQKHFAVPITPPDSLLHTCTFTGEFDPPVLSEILASLSFSTGIQVTNDQNVYAFSGKGCNP